LTTVPNRTDIKGDINFDGGNRFLTNTGNLTLSGAKTVINSATDLYGDATLHTGAYKSTGTTTISSGNDINYMNLRDDGIVYLGGNVLEFDSDQSVLITNTNDLTVTGVNTTINSSGCSMLLDDTDTITISGDITFDGNATTISNDSALTVSAIGDPLTLGGSELSLGNLQWVEPGTSDIVDLGTSSLKFRDIFINSEVKMSSTVNGFKPPELTTIQRNAITAPTTGDTIYNSDTNNLETYDGTQWAYPYQTVVNIVTPVLLANNTENPDFQVFESSSPDNDGWKCFDDDLLTFWSSGSTTYMTGTGIATNADVFDGVNGSYLTTTWLSAKTVSSVQMLDRNVALTNAVDWRILYSVDGTTNWIEVLSITDNILNDTTTYSFAPVVCKAITFQCTRTGGNVSVWVSELTYSGPDENVFRPTTKTSDDRDALVPSSGMVIYNSDHKLLNYRNGDSWHDVSGTAWEFYHGSSITVGNTQVVAAGVTATLINDGLAADTDTGQGPMSGHHFYTSLNATHQGLITPETSGDSYVVGIRLNASSNNVAGAFDILLNLGSGIIVDVGVLTFPKGSGTIHTFDKTTNVYVGDIFKANGATVQLTSLIGNTTISDVAFLVNRVHKARGFEPITPALTPLLTADNSNSDFLVTTSGTPINAGWMAFDRDGVSTFATTSGSFLGGLPSDGIYLNGILCEWLKVQFPSRKRIDNYRVKTPTNTSRSDSWTIQISQDNVNWTPIHSYEGNAVTDTGVIALNCKCKYIAFCIQKNGGNTNAQLYELTYNDPIAVVVPALTSNTGNTSYIASASSIFDTIYEPYNAFDTVTSGDRWITGDHYDHANGLYLGSNSLGGVSGEWIKMSFDYPQLITSHRIYASAANNNPYTYQFLVSEDGVNWTSIYTNPNFAAADTGVISPAGSPYTCLHVAIVIENLPVGANLGYSSMFEIVLA
jgi:hypothetical protein